MPQAYKYPIQPGDELAKAIADTAHYKRPPRHAQVLLDGAHERETSRRAKLAQDYYEFICETGRYHEFVLWSLKRAGHEDDVIKDILVRLTEKRRCPYYAGCQPDDCTRCWEGDPAA